MKTLAAPTELSKKYPYIISELMEYINVKKQSGINDNASLLDIIMDFCFKKELDVEMVGDAIQSDIYFKSFIEKDCQIHQTVVDPLQCIRSILTI